MARSNIMRRQEAERARIAALDAVLRQVSAVARPAPDFDKALRQAPEGFGDAAIRPAEAWRPKLKTRDEAKLRLAAARSARCSGRCANGTATPRPCSASSACVRWPSQPARLARRAADPRALDKGTRGDAVLKRRVRRGGAAAAPDRRQTTGGGFGCWSR